MPAIALRWLASQPVKVFKHFKTSSISVRTELRGSSRDHAPRTVRQLPSPESCPALVLVKGRILARSAFCDCFRSIPMQVQNTVALRVGPGRSPTCFLGPWRMLLAVLTRRVVVLRCSLSSLAQIASQVPLSTLCTLDLGLDFYPALS